MLATHAATCVATGALPQTPGRFEASLGTMSVRSLGCHVHDTLLAAAPPAPCNPGTRRRPVKATPSADAAGAAPGPLPQRGSLDGDPPLACPVGS
jgi:hypothetical protein